METFIIGYMIANEVVSVVMGVGYIKYLITFRVGIWYSNHIRVV